MEITAIRLSFINRRRECRLTQANLALLAGVSREMVVRFENGSHDIGLRRLLRLCDALDLDLTLRHGKSRPVLEELGDLLRDE